VSVPIIHSTIRIQFSGKKAALNIQAMHRMSALAGDGQRLGKDAAELSENVRQYKEESAQEVMEVSGPPLFMNSD
jgi:hypothetical protein